MNPFELLLKRCNTSEGEFRRRFGFAKQTLVDTTAGTYTKVPDQLNLALGRLCAEKGVEAAVELEMNYGETGLDDAYVVWQAQTRAANRAPFLTVTPDDFRGSSVTNPAAAFVSAAASNPTRFSKELLVPPQTVRRWVSLGSALPATIREALHQIAYPYVRELDAALTAWRAA